MRLLADAFDPDSRGFLREVGVDVGWHCWEAGAGIGSMSEWLAEVAGPSGSVLATDTDERWFEADAAGVRFERHDVTSDPPPATDLDLVYARFLLEHLPDPRRVIERLASALRPGGVLVLEDSQGLEIQVGQRAFDDLAAAWQEAGTSVGWDATYGARLADDLRCAGLIEVRGKTLRATGLGGPPWRHLVRGLRRLESEIAALGVAREEVDELTRDLEDASVTITGPPVALVAGISPAT